jgi:putative transposase
MSRQNFYQRRKCRQTASANVKLIGELVRKEREMQPRLGGRKLLHMLKPRLKKAEVQIGRDRFYEALRRERLLLKPLKAWAPRTTNSRHALPVFMNLAEKVLTTGPNQVWVSDLTYLRVSDRFLYLSLVMDRHSRKILGWHCDDTLEATGCLKSLQMALGAMPKGAKPIHHSDRGCQYACHEYVGMLLDHGLAISMTGELHCYENAHAERLNGILKQEYGLGMHFRRKDQALRAVSEAVLLYNCRRPHESLNYQTPEAAHAA